MPGNKRIPMIFIGTDNDDYSILTRSTKDIFAGADNSNHLITS
ncbi:MAG: hypothetical protein Q7R54_00830 [bacterium]|nr:hypothetical protein [bacterium]